jgi:hypothetical protein
MLWLFIIFNILVCHHSIEADAEVPVLLHRYSFEETNDPGTRTAIDSQTGELASIMGTQSNIYIQNGYLHFSSPSGVAGLSLPPIYTRTSSITIEMWVDLNSGGSGYCRLAQFYGPNFIDNYNSINFNRHTSNNIAVHYLVTNPNRLESLDTGTPFSSLEGGNGGIVGDRHIVMVYDNNEDTTPPTRTLQIFMNGIEIGTKSISNLPNIQNFTTAYIGSKNDGSNHIYGKINEVRVWDSVLSSEMIANHTQLGPNIIGIYSILSFHLMSFDVI